MKLGVVFPQTEIGSDPGAVREYAQAAESMGYNHILAFDHVLGANAESRPGWSGAYRHTDAFHEPFVLFGYLAAVTSSVELVTGVIILPQRQTALVAKQTAAVDVLSRGRLRLGIGIGWNAVEYEALGENFHDRGRRSEEQIDLLRKLWTNDLITYEGTLAQGYGRRSESAAGAAADTGVVRGRGSADYPPRGDDGRRLVPAVQAGRPGQGAHREHEGAGG